MSIYYCNHCKTAFLPDQTITDGESLLCKKCQSTLKSLGSEESSITIKGHLESQLPTTDQPPITAQSAKHYTTPTNDSIRFECDQQLKQNPLNTCALFTLSQWYYAKGMTDESVAICKHILTINQSDSSAIKFLQSQKKLTESKRLLVDEKSLEQQINECIQSDSPDQAIPFIQQLLDINPTHSHARQILCDLYISKKNYAAAIQELNRLQLNDPTNSYILYNLGIACNECGDTNRAISNLKAAAKYCDDSNFKQDIQQLLNTIQL